LIASALPKAVIGSSVTAGLFHWGEGVSGVITALKLGSRNHRRVNIYLDGSYGFSVAKVLTTGLEVGQTLTDSQIADLTARDAQERCYQRALRLLQYRPRSERELRDHFNRHQIPSDVQEVVLTRLQNADLVDDEAFAAAWVENRRHFRPRSARALRVELKKKGVSRETIDTALEGLDEDDAAYQAAVIGARRWKDRSWDDFRQRLGAYLARRGFSYATISPVVARVWHEITGVEDESEVTK
jgi:regulatory protein